MSGIDTFAIVGGDKRQVAMAESILSDGYNVCAVGFENADLKSGITTASLKDAVKMSDYIILPVPATTSDGYLNAPHSRTQIAVDDEFAKTMFDKKIFCARAEDLIATSPIFSNMQLYDYSKREEFAVNNAIPTAEGAIQIARQEYGGTINGSRCLVTGFGRIGKVLSKMLKGIGAKVTASARKPKDIAWINLLGYSAVLTASLASSNAGSVDFDIIFNTIPSLIFDADFLARLPKNAVIIDLASLPGGVDFDAARKLKIKAIQALALPGKVAPRAAGEIIKNTIYNMIEEGQL